MSTLLKCPDCGVVLHELEAFEQARERRRADSQRMLADLAATIGKYRMHNDGIERSQAEQTKR